jgi:alkanesulfonate monooxygenase SsuD/methylene tetrahydromethanopterin reductase-like flavin-dependent oxidoreductase (luciferase family)
MTSKITGDLEALMDDTFIVGSPDECVEQIARYRDLGFSQVSIRLFYPETPQKDVLDHIDLVAKNVVPGVHKL